MSEVKRHRPWGDSIPEEFVTSKDFDAEHALRLQAEKMQETWAVENANLRLDVKAEREARLDAERQVGELREQLALAKEALAPKTVRELIEHQAIKSLEPKQINDVLVSLNDQMRTCGSRLETAMGLLRELEGDHTLMLQMGASEFGPTECKTLRARLVKLRAFLNTTSTEGKDHE